MAEPEDIEEDLFADLYDGDDSAPQASSAAAGAAAHSQSVPSATATSAGPGYGEEPDTAAAPSSFDDAPSGAQHNNQHADYDNDDDEMKQESTGTPQHNNEPLQMKDDGKMFIGGLNWETTDQSLHQYFSQFGDVQECTVMRDGATGRSRGFGFLTFKDPKVVNTVMVKEHFLDGKIIDPKRAIPRDEQEKTSKIFVGGVSQEATEQDFTDYFANFGRVVDATLMMDKDTGRPRGFGFVTFDSEAAVERVLEHQPLEILGKMIEVKKAQPRGKIGEDDHDGRGRGRGKFGRDNNYDDSKQQNNNQNQNAMGGNGMTPQMMAQYWQRMQQYFSVMQQQMAANAMGGMGMGQMNPMMMQMQRNMQGGNSPMGGMNMQGMNPQMQQQMMMQMQNGMGMGGGNRSNSMGQGASGFTAQEQQAFEQQKYEQQVAKRQGGRGNFNNNNGNNNQQNQAGPQSWEGMYDGEPQPDDGSQNGRGSAGGFRNTTPSGSRPPKGPTTQAQSNAPANAPTGPKNAGKPGANFRGGRGGGRYHPYGR